MRISVKETFVEIDEEDYELVSQYSWWICKPKYGKAYAQAYSHRAEGRKYYVYMHCLIMGQKGIDHIDGNGLNNQKSNLRFATNAQNQANIKKRPGCSSKYKGVSWNTARSVWIAEINNKGRHIHLGTFTDEEEAARTYDKAARELQGEFAQLNFTEVT